MSKRTDKKFRPRVDSNPRPLDLCLSWQQNQRRRLVERNCKRYSTAVCCFQIVRIFFSKVQTEKISSDFLTFYIISNQKADHLVNQSFLEYLLNILSIENFSIFLKEVCDFLNLNLSYFKLFFENLIQWN